MALPALTWEHRDGEKRAIDARWTTGHRGPPGQVRLQVSPIYTAFSPRRDEPGRTVAPPWRTGKNRSVTGGAVGVFCVIPVVSLCSSRALIWTDFEEVLFAAERTRYRDVIWNADFVARQLMSL